MSTSSGVYDTDYGIEAESGMTSNLFVYGTLLRDLAHPMHEILEQFANRQGTGYINGKLYDIANYPGLILSNNVRKVVWGEIYTIDDSIALFDLLDKYEGCAPHSRKPFEYKRDVVTIHHVDGSTNDDAILAWCYLYKKPVNHTQLIPCGDYLSFRNHGLKRVSKAK